MSPDAARFACNTYSYIRAYPADVCLSRLADLGFVDFEVMVHPRHLWPEDRTGVAALRRVVQERGLRLVSLNTPNIDLNITSEVEAMRAHSIARLEAVIRLAGELGVPGVVIGPGKANPLFPPSRADLTDYLFAALDQFGPIARAVGTELWLENIPFAFLPEVDALCDALDRYGDEALGITYDIANAHYIGEDFALGLVRCASRLRLVHLSDTGMRVYRHDPVGAGSVPFADVPEALARVGHAARPVLEIISADPDRDIPASVTALAGMDFGAGPVRPRA